MTPKSPSVLALDLEGTLISNANIDYFDFPYEADDVGLAKMLDRLERLVISG